MTRDDWQRQAYMAALWWCKHGEAQRKPMTFEAIRLQVARSRNGLDEPTDGRWWGWVCRSLVKAGVIIKTVGTAPAASSNGAAKPVYWVSR